VSDAQFELLKWFFVEVDDDTGFDAATEVIERCMRRVLPGTLVAGGAPVDAIVVRDLLDDLGEVVDAERVKLADLPPRLRKLAATWPEYRSMSGKDLKKRLDELDVRTVNPGNVPQLDAEDLQRAIARRRQAVS
jgi:S-DNA-T family DNA segregation ATPase FtsK/SpoIIIE